MNTAFTALSGSPPSSQAAGAQISLCEDGPRQGKDPFSRGGRRVAKSRKSVAAGGMSGYGGIGSETSSGRVVVFEVLQDSERLSLKAWQQDIGHAPDASKT